MSDPESIAAYVPFLRRYARALDWSQTAADAYVVATLEALIEDDNLLKSGSTERTALYRIFTKIWNSVSINRGTDSPDPALLPDQRLTSITPLPRQAFLLTAVECFSENEAAEILDCDEASLRTLIAESAQQMASEIATDVLIIEDEAPIAMELQTIMEGLGHRVIGVAATHLQALALVRGKKPGLILSDIQLIDGSSGIEAVQDLLHIVEVPVIFITAFPERLLTGERPEPTFLIEKPFDPSVVAAIVSQALFFNRSARNIYPA
jgi:CheY-like chemotaxis protein